MTDSTLTVGRLMPEPGDGTVQHGARIEIADGRISAIEPVDQASDQRLAIPAMVNAHDHGYGTRPVGFGAVDDALEAWSSGLRGRPAVDPYIEATVAFGRAALGGIATTVHCHNSHRASELVNEAAGVARAAADVGIRVAFSCPILDQSPWVYGGVEAIRPLYTDAEWEQVRDWVPRYDDADAQLARIDEVAAAHGSATFNVQYGPIGPQWCKNATLEKIAEASERTGRRVHMHLLESYRQKEWADANYEGGIVRHLDRIGFLSPRLTVAHGIWLEADECALLAERGVTIAVNTSSNLRLRAGVAPVATYLEQGTRFAFGLDGMALDDDQDALRDLRLAYLLHGGTDMDRRLTPESLFVAALINGYAVFDGDRTQGRLAPRANADILCLDYPAMSPDVIGDSANEQDVLLTRVTARHVTDLYVAGTPVVRDGALVRVDLAEVEQERRAQAEKAADALRSTAAARRMHKERIREYYRRGHHQEAGAG